MALNLDQLISELTERFAILNQDFAQNLLLRD